MKLLYIGQCRGVTTNEIIQVHFDVYASNTRKTLREITEHP
jgi:hypothetical protein